MTPIEDAAADQLTSPRPGASSFSAKVSEIQTLMTTGNFVEAWETLGQLGESSKICETLANYPIDDPFRMLAAGTLGELFAYSGDNESVRKLFKDYLRSDGRRAMFLLADRLPVRVRVQIAEVSYANRDFDEAIRLVRTILEDSKADLETPDTAGAASDALWGIGEACYYLARYHVRKELHADTALYCAKALECFSLASPDNPSLTWRAAQVFLVLGHSNWRTGELASARSRLYVSRLLLKQARGDVISIGNVEHTLGSILRSQGRYDEAMRAFTRALEEYEGPAFEATRDPNLVRHSLNRARVLTNIGRTALMTGRWGLAQANLHTALQICTNSSTGAGDPMWLRQKAEVFVWQSRYFQADTLERNLSEAYRLATQARRTAKRVGSRSNVIEALMCMGQCRVLQRDFSDAKSHLTEALDLAVQLDVAKLTVSAHLALAELYLTLPARDLRAADRHHARAVSVMVDATSRDRGASTARTLEDVDASQETRFSTFLRQKADAIKGIIDADVGKLLITPDEIAPSVGAEAARPGDGEKLGLAQVVDRARKWAIEVALQNAKGNYKAAAAALGVTRQALYQFGAQRKKAGRPTGQHRRSRPRARSRATISTKR